MLKTKIILGSTRQGRFGEQPAKWILEKAKAKGLDAELLDLRDYPLPFFDEPETPSSKKAPYANPVVTKWTAKIAEADAFIVVTPEYNHGTSAALKNAIDYVNQEWQKKVVGFVGYGTVGGARAIEQLRQVFPEIHAATVRAAAMIITPWLLPKNADGTTDLSSADAQADQMLDQLTWWGDALKTAREKDAK
ncbi:MAG TPA: NAD(P)H-dependent oxidoreductase [Candidatus Paceibacterota bacterium]|nr:NAD(P)H-dependent oxidoreductase [Candidatus Paceibacterota bacterium]